MGALFTPTQQQLNLLWHSLGLSAQNRQAYRNGFVASVNHHDYSDLKILEESGLMFLNRTPMFMSSDALVFTVTDAGKEVALRLLPEPVEPSKTTTYSDYLSSECGESFAEYLGITMPDIEYRTTAGTTMYRYTRRKYNPDSYYPTVIAGEWATTKKAAKASYKAALKQSKQKSSSLT